MECYLLQRSNMVREWRRHVKEAVKAVSKVLPDANVFGSVVKGEAVGGSDVDIVSRHAPPSNIERAEMKVKIEKEAGLPLHHPFELHLVNEKESEWYFRRVKELMRIDDRLYSV
ncbi:MAG: nucleotidyltransferase domain-containing protein [Candidatus Caldarchaeum sp.]